ncbi:MAG: 16S rRNA (cytosine(967)-C(5))-methyltransferase RsmB [Burkholderiales bacterium]|jgi:16S rRNA (cytosine967-C5)-methyltransferase|nr:16S rRNA (cytosine(967)-C(5))-methyltransferase RsmB [Burkholderiales bacterium]
MASRVVAQVAGGASLTVALAGALRPAREAPASLRGALQDLAYATLRDFGFVDRIADSLVARPPQPEVRALLMVAITSLRAGRRGAHAIVDQAVEAAALLGGERTKGFVNAVLRRFLRERESLERAAEATEAGRFRHPQWWIDRLRIAYPHEWESMLAAANTHPAMTLRVNRRRTTRDAYLARLGEVAIDALAVGEDGVLLAKPMPVDALPGFREGEVSVQDAGAQLAAGLLGAEDGMTVLDACAAPGGKTAHILERADVRLTAVDSDAARSERICENLERLGLAAKVVVGDAARPRSWAGDSRYDRILLDAPCTASGVVRRHPDIKWLRRADDVDRFAATQAALLDALWQRLQPGGRMLYATCSVFPEENVVQVERFLSRHPDARRLAIAHPASGQLLPSHDHDGFFYALLAMQPAAA